MATGSKVDTSFRRVNLQELVMFGEDRHEWIRLFVEDRTINSSHGFNFQSGFSIGNMESRFVPEPKDNKIALYVEGNEFKIKHPDGEIINLSDPMKPSGDMYSIQLKTSDYQIGGDSNFLYDPDNQTLRVYNVAPVDSSSGIKFKLYDTETDIKDIVSIFKNPNETLASSFIFKLGDDQTNMSFDANRSNIENIGILSYYPVGRDSYIETSASPVSFCTAGNGLSPPFNTTGSIVFQSKKGGDVIFSTATENDSFKETLFIKDNSITFQLRDPDTNLSPSINEFFSIHQFDETKNSSYLRIRRTNAESKWWDICHTNENNLEFKNSNGWKAIIRSDTTQNALNYTGRQIVQPSPNNPDILVEHTGRIVSCTGLYNNEDEDMYTGNNSSQTVATYDLALPVVKLSVLEKDPGVLGSIALVEDSSGTERTFFWGAFGTSINKNVNRIVVSTSGVGALWVSNYGGSNSNGVLSPQISIGDLICSSGMEGYGMKQDDDIIHSYTIAKATMNTDFLPSPDYLRETFVYNNITYTAVLVGCVFLTG